MSYYIINKLIPFDKNFSFDFLDDSSIKFMHPVSDYFLKLNDLSINLLISLKWLTWGYVFLSSISNELKNLSEEYQFEFLFQKSLQNKNLEKILEFDHVLLIDNNIIKNSKDLDNLVLNFYNNDIFEENTKIHLKLKINLREYIIIQNILFPTFIVK